MSDQPNKPVKPSAARVASAPPCGRMRSRGTGGHSPGSRSRSRNATETVMATGTPAQASSSRTSRRSGSSWRRPMSSSASRNPSCPSPSDPILLTPPRTPRRATHLGSPCLMAFEATHPAPPAPLPPSVCSSSTFRHARDGRGVHIEYISSSFPSSFSRQPLIQPSLCLLHQPPAVETVQRIVWFHCQPADRTSPHRLTSVLRHHVWARAHQIQDGSLDLPVLLNRLQHLACEFVFHSHPPHSRFRHSQWRSA